MKFLRRLAPAAVVLLISSIASAQPATTGVVSPSMSRRNASYSIDARLDPVTRTITGSEVIAWRNITSRTVDDLQFHLYWNAWRNDRSTWLREAALGGSTYRNRRDDDRGRIDVTSIILTSLESSSPVTPQPDTATGSRADLTAARRFIAPDDGNRDDETVMAVPLPHPVAPGGGVSVEVRWTAHVPRTYARTGAIGQFFFIAQWFPKLGVLQDPGWNCHQFHAGTEFFSDYGVYDVRLTIPDAWPMGATGVERERRGNPDGTATHRYYQEDVHDFAWTTSPDYLVRTARFDDPRLPPVDLRLLLQPEHAGQADRHFDAARATLKDYGEWFGAYPYGHLTIVDPAYQSGAGGMEYPTLFTAGTRWLVAPRVLTPESVTIHEAGHQWWYGMVGTNEFEDAWMDEGLNSYATARVEAAAYDPQYLALRYFGGFVPYVFRDVVLRRETDRNRLGLYRAFPKADAQSTPSYAYFPSGIASNALSYAKTALWLNTLERRIGWPTLQRIMATYFSRWTFKHPRPEDFFNVVSEVGARDLGWYFDQVYRSSDVFDYGVQDLKSTNEGGIFRTSVVVRRYGEAIFPVGVRVTFANGEQVNEEWSGRERWKLYSYERHARAVSAEVDPDRVLLLDIDYTNNSWTLEPRGGDAATKWSLKWMIWLQDLLLSWAFFA
jgi:Peptidase family M1 domain